MTGNETAVTTPNQHGGHRTARAGKHLASCPAAAPALTRSCPRNCAPPWYRHGTKVRNLKGRAERGRYAAGSDCVVSGRPGAIG